MRLQRLVKPGNKGIGMFWAASLSPGASMNWVIKKYQPSTWTYDACEESTWLTSIHKPSSGRAVKQTYRDRNKSPSSCLSAEGKVPSSVHLPHIIMTEPGLSSAAITVLAVDPPAFPPEQLLWLDQMIASRAARPAGTEEATDEESLVKVLFS